MNVWDLTQKRLDIIFNEFDNIYVSFSGGKDSGLLLSLCIKYMRDHSITNKKLGVFHQDFEAQFTDTTKYVEEMMLSNSDILEPFWICLPMAADCATSNFDLDWITWEQSKKDVWCRDMPQYDCVINEDNNKLDFFEFGMHQSDVYKHFGGWYRNYKGGGKTICLVGIRSQESFNRWRAIHKDKNKYKDYKWTTKSDDDVYNGYPIHDWLNEDIWIANGKYEFNYNRIYDKYYYAGLNVSQMRVSSPFHGSAINGLNLYRVIEPSMWVKLLARVKGVNFAAMYANSKMFAYKNIELPPGHTWKSFVEFLLNTLPERTRENYRAKFNTSIEFWKKKGGVLSDDVINDLKNAGVDFKVSNETSNYKTDKKIVLFDEYLDDVDIKEFQSVPTYKRMAICILKNDHTCKYMGFSQTKEQLKKRADVIEKYKNL